MPYLSNSCVNVNKVSNKKVLILNYHDISDNNKNDNLYTLNSSSFIEQIRFIKENNIAVLPLDAVLSASSACDFSVALTFDDGYASHYTEVVPALEEMGFSACFFPVTDMVGLPERLSWNNLKQMSDRNFLIGSHGLSHRLLTKENSDKILEELAVSKRIIEQNINKQVFHFAAPYGWYNKKIIKLAKSSGYRSLLTTGLEVNDLNKNEFVFYRWNITSKTTMDTFKTILQSHGVLPLKTRMLFGIKRYTKKILGHSMSDRINRMS